MAMSKPSRMNAPGADATNVEIPVLSGVTIASKTEAKVAEIGEQRSADQEFPEHRKAYEACSKSDGQSRGIRDRNGEASAVTIGR